jgi:hypothetical protein
MKKTRRKAGSVARASIAASLALGAVAATGTTARAYDQQDYDAYFQSGYSYCDATLLAFAWHTSVEEAKAGIGGKVRNHWSGNDIDAAIAPGRAGHQCSFEDEGYTYEDAVALASYWHITPVAAKARVDQLLTAGHRVMVPQLIERLRHP